MDRLVNHIMDQVLWEGAQFYRAKLPKDVRRKLSEEQTAIAALTAFHAQKHVIRFVEANGDIRWTATDGMLRELGQDRGGVVKIRARGDLPTLPD
jgi:hypothetical protein